MADHPRTLEEVRAYFSELENRLNFVAERRWKNGVVCPTCGSPDVTFVRSRRVWQCKSRHSKCQFSLSVGTIFEQSRIRLDKWLAAIWLIANSKTHVTSEDIHRALGVTQKSAWFMIERIRLALEADPTGASSSEKAESGAGKEHAWPRGLRKVGEKDASCAGR